MKTFILPEMMIHVPMCTHKDPKGVLVVTGESELLKAEMQRYRGISSTVESNADVLETLRSRGDKSVDVLILDTVVSDTAALAHANRILKEDGVMVLRHPSLDEFEANKSLLEVLGKYYRMVMPYNAGEITLLLCSNVYHPTADLILQRSDLMEGQQYYNCDVHIASFAMPQYIRKQYLGLLKN